MYDFNISSKFYSDFLFNNYGTREDKRSNYNIACALCTDLIPTAELKYGKYLYEFDENQITEVLTFSRRMITSYAYVQQRRIVLVKIYNVWKDIVGEDNFSIDFKALIFKSYTDYIKNIQSNSPLTFYKDINEFENLLADYMYDENGKRMKAEGLFLCFVLALLTGYANCEQLKTMTIREANNLELSSFAKMALIDACFMSKCDENDSIVDYLTSYVEYENTIDKIKYAFSRVAFKMKAERNANIAPRYAMVRRTVLFNSMYKIESERHYKLSGNEIGEQANICLGTFESKTNTARIKREYLNWKLATGKK